MKRNRSLLFASVVLLLAIGFASSVMAIPPNRPGPNDNQSICHQTQHHQNNQGNANDNQKGVIINVDPSSISTNPHIKHGDKCVEPLSTLQRAIDACTEAGIMTEAECTGAVTCPEGYQAPGVGVDLFELTPEEHAACCDLPAWVGNVEQCSGF